MCFCSRYKWTIPIKWHSVKSDKNAMAMFNKDSAGIILNLSIFTLKDIQNNQCDQHQAFKPANDRQCQMFSHDKDKKIDDSFQINWKVII